MNNLSVGDAIRYGWTTFKKRPWFFIWTVFVFNLLSGGVNFDYKGDKAPDIVSAWMVVVGVIMAVAFTAVAVLAKMAFNRFLIKSYASPETVGFKENWVLEKFWRFLLASVLKGAIVGIPALLLIGLAFLAYPNMFAIAICVVLAIAWVVFMSVRYMFVELIVLDSDLTAIESLRESERVTSGKFWELILFGLAVAGVCILGLLALIVGIFVAIPVTALAYVYVYRILRPASHVGEVPSTPTI